MSRPCAPLRIVALVVIAFASMSWGDVQAAPASFPGKKTDWNGYVRHDFAVGGRAAFVIVPKVTAEGNPWVWRARFPNYHAPVNVALLKRGFHVAYINTDGMFGSDAAIKHWDRFYDTLTAKHELAPKLALMAVSRGGLFAYRWAAQHPDRVACIYGVVPVCDFKSWPLGRGAGAGSPGSWKQLLAAYKLTPAEAIRFKGNPVDVLKPIAKAGVPILHVVSPSDKVVPPQENTDVVRQRYAQLGGTMRVIIFRGKVANKGHRFDDKNPRQAASFIAEHATVPSKKVNTNENIAETVSACGPAEDDDTNNNHTSILNALTATDGAYSPALRSAYLRWAESSVFDQLSAAKREIPASSLTWVRNDPVIYEAAYGTVYPPDPRVALNLLQLKEELTPELFERYKQLIVAAAVTRRSIGVGPVNIGNTYGATLAGAWHRDQKLKSLVPIATTQSPKKTAAPSVQLTRVSKLIDGYITEQKIDTKLAYVDAKHRAALVARIVNGGVKMDGGKKLVHAIERYLVESGKRPAQRDSHPSVAEYVRYLDDKLGRKVKPFKHPKKGTIRWPLYKTDATPWPMLMPLTRTIPIREAEYIWNEFATKHRYQVYGPYRRNPARWPLIAEQSSWAYDSWPSSARIGGLCGTMSTISMGTHVALGVPVLKASQPGHSCVIKYDRDGRGFYKTTIGQAVAGPMATKSAWLFADPHAGGQSSKERTFKVDMSFHFGLSLAMNVGLRKYMDTRIAVNIYRSLSPEARKKYGRSLLLSAVKINPYNVEPWNLLELSHRIASASLIERADVLQLFNVTVRDSQHEMEPWQERSPDEDLTESTDNDAANNAPLAGHVATWASMVRPRLLRLIASHPVSKDPDTIKTVSDALRPTGGPLYMRYLMLSDDGRKQAVAYLQNRMRQHRRTKGKPQLQVRAQFSRELSAAVEAASGDADRLQLIDAVASVYPPAQRTWKRRGKTVKDPIFTTIEHIRAKSIGAQNKE